MYENSRSRISNAVRHGHAPIRSRRGEAVGHKQGLDSVADLKKRLAKKLWVIEEREEADVTIEVLARGDVRPGTTTPSRDASKDGSDGVHVSLAAGDYRIELAGYRPHAPIIGARRPATKDVTNKSRNGLVATATS
jgi:hypothetical protein